MDDVALAIVGEHTSIWSDECGIVVDGIGKNMSPLYLKIGLRVMHIKGVGRNGFG